MGRKETPIQHNVIQYLLWQGHLILRINAGGAKAKNRDGSTRYVRFCYWSVLGSVNNTKGIVDVLSLSPEGIFCALEVKPDGKYPTKEQKDFMHEVRQRGGIAGVVRSIDDVENLLSRGVNNEIVESEMRKR